MTIRKPLAARRTSPAASFRGAGLRALVVAAAACLLFPANGLAQINTPSPRATPNNNTNNQNYNRGYGLNYNQGMNSGYNSGSSFGSSSQFGSSGRSDWRSKRDRKSKSSRDSKSSRSSRSSSSSSSGSSSSSAPAAKKTTLRTSAARSGGFSRTYKSSGSKSQSTLSEFQLHVDKTATVLYFEPSDVTVAEGATFKTPVWISNPQGKSFNEVRLALHYDRDVVKPLSYADKSLKPHLASDSRIEVDPQLGVLLYTAHLQTPFSKVTAPLFEVKWKALELTNRANISFVGYKGKSSGLWMGETDILGNEDNPNDGFINASVQALPPDLYEQFKQGRSRRSSGAAIEEISLNQLPARVGGVTLRLAGPNHPVEVGDTFKVDVVLDNSADSFVDRVDVYIRYNPDVLEVLDTDDNNWMTRGINILDGPYHATFPFDYHITNQVYPGRGEIVYRMGMTDPERLRHRVGTMATITFRAKAPVPSTRIAFETPERDFAPGTKLRYLDESVLGEADEGKSGIRNLSLRVVN